MAEQDNSAQENQENQAQFAIQRIYLKDVSFETPNSPAVFTSEWQPEIKLDLNTNVVRLSDGVFEVTLMLTVTCKAGDKTAYLAEVHQAGIFTIVGFDEATLGGMLGSYCPNILFPYAREEISSLVSKGSFPQLLLAPINFDAMYAQHLAQQQQQGQEQAADTPAG